MCSIVALIVGGERFLEYLGEQGVGVLSNIKLRHLFYGLMKKVLGWVSFTFTTYPILMNNPES